MSEGFESAVPAGWTRVNNSSPIGSTGWFQGDVSVFSAHAGATHSYAGANYNNTGSTGTISNWLISPKISTLSNDDAWSFYTRQAVSPYADRLEFRLSTNGSCTPGVGPTSVGDFTTVLTTINPGLTGNGYPETWTEFSGALNGLSAKGKGCFAFRYYVTSAGGLGTNSDYIGVDTFSFTEDVVNDAPVAADDTASVDEDQTLAVAAPGVLANDTDDDADPITATLVDGPSHGVVVFHETGSYSYIPEADYNGTDSFTYNADDGTADSNTATVNITVDAVNDTPVAVNDTASVDEDDTLIVGDPGVLENDTDTEGDNLIAVLVDGPSHGVVTLNDDGSYSYIPEADYNGTDSFTYTAGDGTADSDTATVNITVDAVNDTPVAVNDSASVDEDDTLTVATPGVLDNDTDTEGDDLTAALADEPSHGAVTLRDDGSYSYTPEADYNGTDSFTYNAGDGTADSNTATVNITVNPVGDTPVAVNDTASVDEDDTLIVGDPGVLDNDTDTDGDNLTAVLVDEPSHGAVTLNDDGSFTYTPEGDYNGGDSFTYEAGDGLSASNTATVDITVVLVDDAPGAVDDTASLDEDAGATTIDVLDNDTDADAGLIEITAVTQPANGAVAITGAGTGLTYTPNPGYCNTQAGGAPDTFTYKLNGGSTATVSVTVTCAPPAPAPITPSDPAGTPDAPAGPAQQITRIAISHPRVRLRKGLIEVQIICRAAAGSRCRGTLKLQATDLGNRHATTARAGNKRFDIAAGTTRTVKVKPNAEMLAILEASGKLVVRATARLNDTPADQAIQKLLTVLPERGRSRTR
jgi:VCBS repeat-containing protein